MAALQFAYDVVCPYAWLAFSQLDGLIAAGVDVQLRPILLGGVLRSVGSPDQPATAMGPNKARLNLWDAPRQADLLGVQQSWHPRHPVRSLDAMRLITAAPADQRFAVTRALFEAIHVHHRAVDQRSVLAEIAADFGLDVAVVDDPAVKDALRQATDAAVAKGAFGVPTMWFGDRMVWGADRLPLVRAALGVPQLAAYSGAVTGGTVELFHDVSSPYGYLGATQAEALAARAGATLVWRPILLGALFQQVGTPTIPIASMVPARQRYLAVDLADWAAHHGVKFTFNRNFPMRTVTAQRVLLVEPRATMPLHRAAWADDLDVGRDEVLVEVLDQAGFHGQALIDATQDPQIKDALKANTARAAAVGGTGAPTWLVNGQHVFWGQDRIDQVEACLRGWVPPEAR